MLRPAGIVKQIYDNMLADVPDEQLRSRLSGRMRAATWELLATKGQSIRDIVNVLTTAQKQLCKATEGKMLAEDLVEIGKRRVRRIVRKGYETGEDYLDESKRYIKHNPWKSVGVAPGVGLTLGFIGGLFSKRH